MAHAIPSWAKTRARRCHLSIGKRASCKEVAIYPSPPTTSVPRHLCGNHLVSPPPRKLVARVRIDAPMLLENKTHRPHSPHEGHGGTPAPLDEVRSKVYEL